MGFNSVCKGLNLVVHRLPVASEGLTKITPFYVIYPVMRIIRRLLPDIDLAYIIYANDLYYTHI
jgi:hypothetical protein